MLGQTSGVTFPQYDNEESSYQYTRVCANSLRAAATQHVDRSAVDLYLWRHLTAPVCSAPGEHQETLLQRNVYTCQNELHRPETFESAQNSMVRRAHVCID